jgi:predicted RNA-binding Zn-ribbon protein involved in translation (DUF1610 family)
MLARVLLMCSVTGELVDTSIAVDPDEFSRSELENHVFSCPICGKPHVWNKERVRLKFEEASSIALISGR